MLVSIGCSNATQQTANTNIATQKSDNSLVVSSHSSDAEKIAPARQPEADSNAFSKGSSPMAKAVDVNQMTAEIEKAEKVFKQKQKDEKSRESFAKAYFVRAFALTEAAQYRSALGDFRKGLKLNPNDAAAKAMHDRILEILKSFNREPPKEGEEPLPLPF